MIIYIAITILIAIYDQHWSTNLICHEDHVGGGIVPFEHKSYTVIWKWFNTTE